MALMGAEVLFYPTAIGNEPQDPTISAKDHWQRTMQGHAAANMMPLVADLDRIKAERASWGLFRDRRPDLYAPLLTADGGRR